MCNLHKFGLTRDRHVVLYQCRPPLTGDGKMPEIKVYKSKWSGTWVWEVWLNGSKLAGGKCVDREHGYQKASEYVRKTRKTK